ncbi:MAG: O-antigen ligase family protein [Phocaeicola vulgatus]|jgi:hypothetical protein|uniref:O-antigen ligase domain-containing protein n=1 Tax=Phocaeicola vulgatus TaxID=821 RepID=A0A7K0JAU1_PHOVU|nr:O-antigen ligase family protein [Phocaeicola vulgatus]MCI7755443.1 O-antigen ligase family protein [Phocaeicola vulgatus]MDD7694209.1 O-antigen ligase family protein [Phocaeicola vulgatus]MDY2676928.1 O-antigen ligase family protein [Phocaeicola vulgatus]MSS47087.1 hypothetical protein [Phocaeicola vulgatus]
MSVKQDSRLLVKAFFFLAIVDTINGFFLNKGIASPIGIIFKAFILLVACKMLSSLPRFKGLLFFTCVYIPFFLTIVILNTDSQIGVTITHLLKFVNVVFIYYAAVVIFKSESISEKKIQAIFYINSIVLLLNIYMGLLGIGYYAYENNLGCRGFIYAHNEMSGMQAVLFGVSYYFIYDRYASRKTVLLLVNCFLLVAALLVATKAGILLVVLCLILVPWVHMKNGILYSVLRMSKKKLLILLSIVCLMSYYGYVLLDYSGAIGRWAYFFDKNGVNAIYSSRDIFWEEEKTEWEEGNLGVKLFGMGGSRTVEMDQADTLLNYGIAGIIIVYSFYLSLVVKAFRKRKINPYARFVFGLDVFILAASCFAGHLLFSGLMGIPFALMNALIYKKE